MAGIKNGTCIWQRADGQNWRYDLSTLTAAPADLGRAKGFLFGRLADIGFLCDQIAISALTEEADPKPDQ